MNKNNYRLVFSRVRGMLIAVEETATASGKAGGGERPVVERVQGRARFALRHAALAVLLASGVAPVWVEAQIVPGGGNAPSVIQTPNGLPQVNINRPTGNSGVSLNTYNQFDVSKSGAILNNSPVIVNTQQAGVINGNPNFLPGQSARLIVNQVNSNNPSLIKGYVEIAGPKANVILANPSGLILDGGGFINTSRATLTTGTPLIDANGNVTGINVTQGSITVQGAGFNASNVDQVDLLARAVQINAATYGNALNVIAGPNHIDYGTLAATPIAGTGAVPSVGIDVSQLGGMYAGKILLASNEYGVGVSNAGVVAAQAGDLTLQSNGRLVLSGRTQASGNMALSATNGVTNNGTTYAQQSVSVNTGADLTNTGTLAAQQNTSLNAGSVNSTGTLGAGINGDGSVSQSGNLSVATAGQLAATGQNIAGGNEALTGTGVNLAGSRTAANGAITLNATAGDANLANATTSAQGAINTQATGAVINDHGALSGGSSVTLTGTTISNQGGQTSAQGELNAQASGQILNQAGALVSQGTETINGGAIVNDQGAMQSAGAMAVSGASLQNNAGRVVSLNSDGLSVTTTGQIVNTVGATATGAQGGVIGGNGGVNVQGGSVVNHGAVSAGTNLTVTGGTVDDSNGSLQSAQTTTVNAGSHLSNAGGTISGQTAVVNGTTIDNSSGVVQAAQVALNGSNLLNHAGVITQTGTGPMAVNVSNTLDNSQGGTLQTNSADLTLAPATLLNDNGTITHAGTGTLTLGNGTGSISNVGGHVVSNGQIVAQTGTLDNTSGSVIGQTGLAATVGRALTNDGGQLGSGTNATIHSGALSNQDGKIVAPNLAVTVDGTLDNSSGSIQANQAALTATDLLNQGGNVTQFGTGPTTVNVADVLDNSQGGVLQTNSTNLTLAPASLVNDGGKITLGGTGTLTIAPGNGAGAFSNVNGSVVSNGQAVVQAGTWNNTQGTFAARSGIVATVAGDITNSQGLIRSQSSLALTSGGALLNQSGQVAAGTTAPTDTSTLAVQSASIDNTGGTLVDLGTGDTTVQGGSQLVNAGGTLSGNGNVVTGASSIVNTNGAQLSGANVQITGGTLDNSSGKVGSSGSGDVGLMTTGAITNTNGQIGSAHDLTVSAPTLLGGGTYSAARNAQFSLQGDFNATPDYSFNAGNLLGFSLPGTFTNSGYLQAVYNLHVSAGDIVNSGTMMAGNLLSTQSNTLSNTGTMVGSSASLAANSSITNVGPTALIGASDSNGTLELLAPVIQNRDDTTATDTAPQTAIVGLGKVVLAGGKDAGGNYVNAQSILNQSALIQSGSDMTLDANQVTNTRRVMTTTGDTTNVDPALLQQLGISLSGQTGQVNTPCPTCIGGVYTDPPHGGQWNSNYEYTTYTGVAVANTIQSISPAAQIMSGGNLDASSVGTLKNYWSNIAAVGNIKAPANYDANSWGDSGQQAPSLTVTYSGQYHYNNYDNTEHDWQLPFGNAGFVTGHPGGYTQAAPADVRTYALPGYESTFVSGGTLSGSGVNINNTAGNAGLPSLGLVAGQAAGFAPGTVTGSMGSTGKSASVSGAGLMVNPIIATATALNVLNNLTVPQGGLFKPDTAPNAPYLIETNPAFTSQRTFMSSDYYLQALGLNPQTVEKRLGDGFYEQQLVREQITSLTGKAVLGPYTDIQSMYEAMMASGATLAKSLGLSLGASLTADEVANLTSNVIIMQTQVVDGQSVLVPVVYLAKASQQNWNGPLIAATNVDLQNTQSFTNSGTVSATNSMTINGQSIDSAFGALSSGGLMDLNTAGNIDFTSANVKAGSLNLNAGGDLLLNTATNTTNQVSASGATRVNTTLGPIAQLNVTGDAAIATGGNLEQNAGNLNVGGSLAMNVGGNWDLGAVQTGEHKVVARANGVSNTDINSVTGSSVKVGGVSAIGVGGDLTAKGADISLGQGGTVAVKGNATFETASATSTIDSNSSGSDSHGSYAETFHKSDQSLLGTSLNSGNNLTIASGKDLTVNGSSINLDKGNLALAATGDVNIGAATETHTLNTQEHHEHSNVVSGTQVASSNNSTTTLSQGSTVSADGVSILSGHDINVAGSTVAGTNDVSLTAAHDVTITTTQDTQQSSSSYQEKHTGLGTSGLSVTVGTNKLATTDNASSVTNNGSVVGSLDGNLSIQAGNTLHVTGSDLVAAQNVTGTAANVIIDSATDTSQTSHTQQASSSGLTIGLAGSAGDAINNAYAQGQSLASGNSNGRAEALHGIAAAGDAAMAGLGAAGIASGATGPNAPSIGVQVSIGSSHSQSQSSEDQTTQRGSNVQAAGTAAFVATGNGTPGSGNLTIAGSNVSANDVVLAAKNQVNVVNTTNTDVTQSSNSSSSASVGVSLTTSGFGVSASMQNAHGDGNSNAAIQNASHVNGANSVTVGSGGDTNIIGSQINGGQVATSVGGNLNIQSVQDTTVSTAHQSSAGGGFSISQGGGSASFSAQNGHADGNYAQVNEQAGINAGNGGFDVNVKGNTNLTGAVISSTADASKNNLTTGTLTYSDIQNQSHYDATSNGISAGVGFGGSTGKAVGPGSVSNTASVAPMVSQNDNGDQSSTTRSAVSSGTVNITNQAAQTQDAASLSRDTANTNGKVSNTPDVNNLLSQQADTMQAAQAAGQVVAQGIGLYADNKRNAAQIAGDSATANAWDEGGSSRALLQTAGGALIGGLGGGSIFTAVGGGAGAYVASKAAKGIADIENGVTLGTGSQVIGNLAGNIAAGLGGALVGGTAGAATGSAVQLYNQSLDDEAQLTGERKSSNPFSQSPAALIAQGIANGLNAIFGMVGGEPPAASGGVLVNSTGQTVLGATKTSPPNAMLSNGGNGNSSSQQSEAGSTSNGNSSSSAGSLSGSPTQIPPLSDAVTTRSLVLENQSATTLANNGYDVVQNPNVAGPKNPDYLVNGQVFDNYAPSTGNVRNIASTISDKVSSGQASNIVVNLADSSATPSALENQLNSYPVPGLQKVIVIDKSGNVINLNLKGK